MSLEISYMGSVGTANNSAGLFKLTPKESVKEVQPTHKVIVFDRSGSMYCELSDLVDDIKKLVREFNKQDYVSIIWFSGANQAGQILSGVSVADFNANIDKTLDNYKNTVGLTCFSNAIAELVKVCENLPTPELKALPICLYLQTDGEPCVSWSTSEEITKTLNNLSKLNILSHISIGYGGYNRRFLTEITTKGSANNEVRHINTITDFSTVVLESDGIISKNSIITVPTSEVDMGRLITDYVAVVDGSVLFPTVVNGELSIPAGESIEIYSLTKAKTAQFKNDELEDKKNTFYYLKAYAAMNRGNKSDALASINAIGDKHFGQLILDAFTLGEIDSVCRELVKAVVDTSTRFQAGKGATKTGKNMPCVLGALDVLKAANAKFIKLETEYTNSTKTVENTGTVKFEADESVPVDFDIVLNKDQFNASIRINRKGSVTLSEDDANAVKLDRVQKCTKYSTYTVVKNSKVYTEKISFAVPKESVQAILDYLKSKLRFVVNSLDETHDQVTINFKDMPIINRAYAVGNFPSDDPAKLLLNLINYEEVLACSQKVISFFEKTIPVSARASASESLQALTPDQIKMLEAYGIRKDKSWSVPKADAVTASAEESDYFTVCSYDFGLAGFSTLPKVEEVLQKEYSTLNAPGKVMADFINNVLVKDKLSNKNAVLNVEGFKEAQKKIKEELESVRRTLWIFKVATTMFVDSIKTLLDEEEIKYELSGDKIVVNKDDIKFTDIVGKSVVINAKYTKVYY